MPGDAHRSRWGRCRGRCRGWAGNWSGMGRRRRSLPPVAGHRDFGIARRNGGGTEAERWRAWERVTQVPGAPRRGLGGTGHRPVAEGDPPAARGGAAELQMRRERSGRQVRCQCRSSAAGCHRGRAGGPFHPDQVGGSRGSRVLDAYPHLQSAGADGRWAGRSCRGLAECNSARQSFKPCATSADVCRPTPAGRERRSGRAFGAPEIVENRGLAGSGSLRLLTASARVCKYKVVTPHWRSLYERLPKWSSTGTTRPSRSMDL